MVVNGCAGCRAGHRGEKLADAAPGKPVGAAGLNDPAALRAFTHDAELRDSLFLVRNGVPFDAAFSLGWFERRAMASRLGERFYLRVHTSHAAAVGGSVRP